MGRLFCGLMEFKIVVQLVDKFIGELKTQLEDKNVVLELTDAARNWLAEHGFGAGISRQ